MPLLPETIPLGYDNEKRMVGNEAENSTESKCRVNDAGFSKMEKSGNTKQWADEGTDETNPGNPPLCSSKYIEED